MTFRRSPRSAARRGSGSTWTGRSARSPRWRLRSARRVAGMEQADSIAVDLHKWGYLPFEVGLALVRDPEAHRATFATSSRYLDATPRGIVAGGLPFAELGRAALPRVPRAQGVDVAQGAWGRRLGPAGRAERGPGALPARPGAGRAAAGAAGAGAAQRGLLPVLAPGLDGAALDAVNQEILLRVQERGIAVPSSTVLGGRFALRVAITNHRSRREDFDLFVDAVLAIGAELTAD